MLVANLVQLKTMPGMFGFQLFQQLSDLLDVPCNMKEVINEHLLSCHVLIDEGVPVGRFAIYKNDDLKYKSRNAVSIGAYACVNDDFVASKLLTLAFNICKEIGYDYVIGPMNGSTWNQYRFKTSKSEDSFFLDVHNPDYYNKQFQQAGFLPIAQYFSNLDEGLNYDAVQLDKFDSYYREKGAVIRNIDLSNLEEELVAIADFSNLAFANNFLFTPIERQLFVNKYLQLGALMDSRFIWIVEDQGKSIHAVCFAIKDVTDPTGKTIIIKTVAVRPHSPFKGIGTYLCRNLMRFADAMGFERIIHALIIENNVSLNASEKYSRSFCKYTLYGKSLK